MKRVVVLFAGFMLLMPLAESQKVILKPYGLKSGIIEYSYSGDKTGTGTLYFDDYGMKSAMYMKTVSDGEESKSWVLTSDNYQYMWDPARPDQGIKMKNPLMTGIQQLSAEEIENLNVRTYEKMGMKKTGTEKFLGRECDLLQGTMGKVLIWKGVLILMDLKMGEYVSRQEATSVKTDIAVDQKYFAIPKNITFQEMAGF